MSEYPARRSIVVFIITVIVLWAVLGLCCGKPARPEAAFSVTPAADSVLLTKTPIGALPPLTVHFTDQSSGKITSWKWIFGDGEKSTLQNPTHTYTSPGRYNVTLTVQGPGGNDTSREYLVTVLLCSEAANSELLQARQAIQACLQAAGQTSLDSAVTAWDGSRGKVTAGNGTKDAADYLGDWKSFRATYNVSHNGMIISGTDVSWGCIVWRDDTDPPRWRDPAEI